MFDISDAIKSVGEAFTSLFNYFKTAKSVQSEPKGRGFESLHA